MLHLLSKKNELYFSLFLFIKILFHIHVWRFRRNCTVCFYSLSKFCKTFTASLIPMFYSWGMRIQIALFGIFVKKLISSMFLLNIEFDIKLVTSLLIWWFLKFNRFKFVWVQLILKYNTYVILLLSFIFLFSNYKVCILKTAHFG